MGDPAAELPACALALGARFVLESLAGRREVAAADFFQGQNATARRRNELLLETLIPIGPDGVAIFLELARRHGDFAIAGLAWHLKLEAGSVADGRLAYFGSEDKPTLARKALAEISGKRLNGETGEAAAAALADDLAPMSSPQGSAKMRLYLQRVLTRRALEMAAKRAEAAA